MTDTEAPQLAALGESKRSLPAGWYVPPGWTADALAQFAAALERPDTHTEATVVVALEPT